MSSAKTVKMKILKQQMLDESICQTLASHATQLVMGEGNTSADVVFVGEAPGKKEDETGMPFMGAAGKFLNELLASIRLKREDVYITNIVKFRPPNNRDPLSAEKQAFLPFLKKQLTIINPKLIVTLGRHSMDCLLPGLKISQAHGQQQSVKGQAYLPLYHPAAALYNGSLRQTLLDDFAAIPAILKKIN